MKNKLLAALLAAALALSFLTGCGGPSAGGSPSDGGSGEAVADNMSDEVEIVMYVIGDRPMGQDTADEDLNQLLKKRLNCTLKINWLGREEYEQKYPLLFSSGDAFDMAYCAEWLGFSELARSGAFMKLDTLFRRYAPDNYAQQSRTALAQATVDGHLYAVPSLLPAYNAYGCIYRGDMAAEAGIADPIDTFEEIQQYCDYITANYPEMEPIDEHSSGPELSLVWAAFNGFYDIGADLHFLFCDPSAEHPTVMPLYDLDGAADFYKRMKEWSDKGYWSKSVLADTDSQKTKDGRAALMFGSIDAWSGCVLQRSEWDFRFAAMTKDVSHVPFTQDCMIISSTSKNPERALALWNLITTDQEVYDAFCYGVEGTTYELNDKGQVTVLDAEFGQTGATKAACTMKLNRSQAGVPEAYDTIRREWEAYIQDGVGAERLSGFVWDTTAAAAETEACIDAMQQYGWPLELGYTDDVEASIEEYRQVMKSAGIDKVVEECQKQLDAYIAGIGQKKDLRDIFSLSR